MVSTIRRQINGAVHIFEQRYTKHRGVEQELIGKESVKRIDGQDVKVLSYKDEKSGKWKQKVLGEVKTKERRDYLKQRKEMLGELEEIELDIEGINKKRRKIEDKYLSSNYRLRFDRKGIEKSVFRFFAPRDLTKASREKVPLLKRSMKLADKWAEAYNELVGLDQEFYRTPQDV